MLNLLRSYISSYRGLPRAAWMLFVVMLVNRSGMMVVFFLSLYLTKELHFTTSQTGQLVSIYGIGSLIGSYAGGWLTDRIGTFLVQLFSLLLSGIAIIILGFMHSFAGLAVSLVFVSILNDALRPASITAFAEICPPEMHARAFAFNRLGLNLGIAIGPAVGGYLVTISYGLIFWVDGLTCFIAGILFFFLFRHYHARQVQDKKNANRMVIKASPWKDGFFIMLMSVFLVLGIVFFQLFNTWPLYLKEYVLLPEPKIGILFTLNAVLIVLIEMPLVHRLESQPPLKVAVLGSILIVSGFVLLNVSMAYSFIIFTVILWTMGEILVFPMTAAVIAKRTNDNNRGVYMGVYTVTFSLSFIIGPVLGSWVYETWGPGVLWYCVGAVGGVVVLAMMGMYIKSKSQIEQARA